jgi:cation diffusion facilitator family transporter
VFFQEKGGLRNPAIRITWIGLLVNLSMAVGKGIGGVVFHSQALLADAVHALSDLVSDFLTLATVSVASSPPSKFFPNGYGKIETLGSLGVSALLLLAGVSVGWSGLISLAQQLLGDSHIVQILVSFFGHGHSHSHGGGADDGHLHVGESDMVDLNAMWLALASIGVKEWLFRATMNVANKTGSTVLVANAWHHRVDSLTSIVAVCTIGGSYALGLSWLDAFGGLLVSSVIIRAGLQNGKAAALELADNTSVINPELIGVHREHVESILIQHAAESLGNISPNDFSVANLKLMPSGPNFLMEVELGLNRPDLPTSSAVSTAAYVERELLKRDPRVKRVIVTIVTDNKPQN